MAAADRGLARLGGRMEALSAALLAGDLAAVEALGPEIEGLAAALPAPVAADRAALERLRAAAGRNARLLAAAREGLSAVRARLAAGAEAGGAALATYDALGRRAGAAPPPARLERRA